MGAVAWAIAARSGGGWATPAAVLAVTVAVLGAIEVATIRATGRRRPVAAWLPAALGLTAALVVDHLASPPAPDAGLARSLAMGMVLVASASMAVGVHLIAGIARVAGFAGPRRR